VLKFKSGLHQMRLYRRKGIERNAKKQIFSEQVRHDIASFFVDNFNGVYA
jgi:predicted acetyltransferase